MSAIIKHENWALQLFVTALRNNLLNAAWYLRSFIENFNANLVYDEYL